MKYEDHAVVFYREEKHTYLEYSNKPLYITTFFIDEESRRGLVDQGSSLDIMPLSILKEVGIPQEDVVKQPIEISGFGADALLTLPMLLLI